MAESVETIVPATEAELAAHEAVDQIAHEAISETEDEDVKWLTSELQKTSSALSTLQGTVAALQESQSSKFQELITAMQENREQSRTLIESQTRMIETLTTNLSALSSTALVTASQSSNAIPQNSESESQQVIEPIVEAAPANVAEGNREPATPEKKRRRL